MGKLNDVKKEIFAHKVVKYQGDAKKALQEVNGEAYDNERSLSIAAGQWLNSPDVSNRIVEIMDLCYTPEELKSDIQDMRKAKKPIVYNGEVTDEYPDYTPRLEMLKLYFKAKGVTHSQTPTSQTNVQFNVNTIDPEQALKIAQEINSLSKLITKEKSGRRN
jgi:hypothetical protein